MTPFSRLLKLYISAGVSDELSLLRREKRNSIMGFLPFRRAARKTSDGGSASSWQKRARRRTPSRCITIVWMWKPLLTSVTLCGIPSCERHWAGVGGRGKAAEQTSDVSSPFFWASRWATSSSRASADPRTYDEVSNEDMQVCNVCPKPHYSIVPQTNIPFNALMLSFKVKRDCVSVWVQLLRVVAVWTQHPISVTVTDAAQLYAY